MRFHLSPQQQQPQENPPPLAAEENLPPAGKHHEEELLSAQVPEKARGVGVNKLEVPVRTRRPRARRPRHVPHARRTSSASAPPTPARSLSKTFVSRKTPSSAARATVSDSPCARSIGAGPRSVRSRSASPSAHSTN